MYYELPTPICKTPAIRAIALAPFSYKKDKFLALKVTCNIRQYEKEDIAIEGKMIVADSTYKKGFTR